MDTENNCKRDSMTHHFPFKLPGNSVIYNGTKKKIHICALNTQLLKDYVITKDLSRVTNWDFLPPYTKNQC